MRVADGDPAIIEIFTFVDVPPGMTAADIRTEIDADTPRRIVDAIGKTLNAQYVYPALAKKMAQALHAHLEHGDDQAIATGPELAAAGGRSRSPPARGMASADRAARARRAE